MTICIDNWQNISNSEKILVTYRTGLQKPKNILK